MFENKTRQQAQDEILAMVKEFADTYHRQTAEFQEGQKIPYASRSMTVPKWSIWWTVLWSSGLRPEDTQRNLRKNWQSTWG